MHLFILLCHFTCNNAHEPVASALYCSCMITDLNDSHTCIGRLQLNLVCRAAVTQLQPCLLLITLQNSGLNGILECKYTCTQRLMDKCLDYFVFLPEADILILYNISELFGKLQEEEKKLFVPVSRTLSLVTCKQLYPKKKKNKPNKKLATLSTLLCVFFPQYLEQEEIPYYWTRFTCSVQFCFVFVSQALAQLRQRPLFLSAIMARHWMKCLMLNRKQMLALQKNPLVYLQFFLVKWATHTATEYGLRVHIQQCHFLLKGLSTRDSTKHQGNVLLLSIVSA